MGTKYCICLKGEKEGNQNQNLLKSYHLWQLQFFALAAFIYPNDQKYILEYVPSFAQ